MIKCTQCGSNFKQLVKYRGRLICYWCYQQNYASSCSN